MRRSRYGHRRIKRTSKRALPEIHSENNPFTHLKRTPAELIFDPGVGRPKTIYHAMVILNEMTPFGIHLFAQGTFPAQQELTLNIPSLRNFFIKGRIVGCKEIPLNHGIMSAQTFRYRLELEFQFKSEAEQQAVRDYCNYLKATVLSTAA